MPGMREPKKKPGVVFWATVVVVVALLSVASFGVCCRYKNPGGPTMVKASTYVWPYYPMFWLMDNGPAPVKSAIRSYFVWCLR